jgi:hypothetical protein
VGGGGGGSGWAGGAGSSAGGSSVIEGGPSGASGSGGGSGGGGGSPPSGSPGVTPPGCSRSSRSSLTGRPYQRRGDISQLEADATITIATMPRTNSAQKAAPIATTIFSPDVTGAVIAAPRVRTSQYSFSRLTTIG